MENEGQITDPNSRFPFLTSRPVSRFSLLASRIKPHIIFLLIALSVFYMFLLWGYHYVAADFTDWYYPWRYNLVGKDNRNTYISNRSLGDPLFMFAPMDRLYNKQIKKGELLLWNHRNLAGHPVYASHNRAFFYPPKIIANYLFDYLSARDITGILHLYLMAAFMYFFLRNLKISRFSSTAGGILWMLNSFVITRLEFGVDIYPLVYLPFILWMIDKITDSGKILYAVGLAGAVGLCILSGHWQFAFYVFLMSAFYAVFRLSAKWRDAKTIPWKKGLTLLFTGILGIGLAAICILPVIELLKHAERPQIGSLAQVFSFSRLLPENLLTLIIPDLFGNPVHHFYFTGIKSGVQQYFELALYFGILPLFLSLAAIYSQKLKRTVFFFTHPQASHY
ncbi:MAG: YfhO family protein [Candidatus Eremiobacteraeota bacterium]|nr:YfhO family protein [Candidatus Eremiobacteraeota bacterium]